MEKYSSQPITAQLFFQEEHWLVETRCTFSCRNRKGSGTLTVLEFLGKNGLKDLFIVHNSRTWRALNMSKMSPKIKSNSWQGVCLGKMVWGYKMRTTTLILNQTFYYVVFENVYPIGHFNYFIASETIRRLFQATKNFYITSIKAGFFPPIFA